MVLIASAHAPVYAQASTGKQDELLKNNSWAYRYENDVFLGIDRYYTQGGRLEFSGRFLQRSPINYLLPALSNDTDRVSIFMEHNCFTPTSTDTSIVQVGDHPYGGVFLIGQERASYSSFKHRILIAELAIGWLGPSAECEWMQKSIHSATNNDEPLGWDNQLNNAFVINYKLSFEQGLINMRWMTFSSLMRVRLGTLYDDMQVGARIRLGQVSNAFAVPDKVDGLVWHAFAETNLEFVAFNATMQGGLFNVDDIYSISAADVEGIVFVAKTGVQLAYRSLVLEYTLSYNSPKFTGGLNHKYGRAFLRCFF